MQYVYRLFFILTLIICFNTSSAQNAFYDSKRIVSLIKSEKYNEIIPLILSYTKDNEKFPWAKMATKYPDHIAKIKFASDSKYQAFLTDKLKNKDSVNIKINNELKKVSQNHALMNFKGLVHDYYELQSKIESLQTLQNELGGEDSTKPFTAELESNFVHVYDTVILNQIKSEVRNKTIDSNILQGISKGLDEMVWIYNLENLWLVKDDLNTVLISMSELLTDPVVKRIMKIGADQKNELEENRNMLSNASRQISEREIYYNDAISKSSLRSGAPSQAEMIDALAVYLAKRVKQEVAISFIEKLGAYIRDERILSNLFPATLQLLNNQDAYSRPNFGTSWHIALSEDFVRIPDNLSKCIPIRYDVLKNYLNDGVQIAKLVQLKYSFVEGVNRLHDDALLHMPPMKYSNEVLYMVNHELYDTNSSKGYWLTADNLRALNTEQLEWFYILLDIRYGESLHKSLKSNWSDKNVWKQDYFVKKVYPFRNWMMRILLQLNHFENDTKQLALVGETRTENSMNAKVSGYWKFQNELMDVVIDTNFIQLPAEANKWIDFTRGVFSLYSSIETKNYALVVDQLLKVLLMLEVDKQVDLQEVLYNRNFAEALQRKDEHTRSRITSLFNLLNEQYDELTHSTEMNELLGIYDSLRDELNHDARKYTFKYNGNASELRVKIVDMIGDDLKTSFDSVLFSKEYLDELNNGGRNATVKNKIYRMNQKMLDLYANKSTIKSSIVIYDSLKTFLHENRLDDPKYARINPVFVKRFVKDKVFNVDAGQYNIFLNSVESRTQYKKVLTTLSFLSDVMQAGNSLALSKVIEAYAMPPSSYKVKRHSRFSINIDAMVGGYTGVEYIKDIDGSPAYTAVGGLTAPIGVSLNWGKRSSFFSKRKRELSNGEFGFVSRKGAYKTLKGYNLSLLMSVIDIGAVVSYRISESNGNGLPADAKWSQVFSPGVTGLVGIKGLPLCIGSGLRFTPNLRSLDGGLQRNAVRFDFGIYFDLPMANVYYR